MYDRFGMDGIKDDGGPVPGECHLCNQFHEIMTSHLSIAVEGLVLAKTYSAQWLALYTV